MNILGAHIDSPRIDLKANPVYESDGLLILILTTMEESKNING